MNHRSRAHDCSWPAALTDGVDLHMSEVQVRLLTDLVRRGLNGLPLDSARVEVVDQIMAELRAGGDRLRAALAAEVGEGLRMEEVAAAWLAAHPEGDIA